MTDSYDREDATLSRPGCISASQNVIAPTIEGFHDARKQSGSDDGVTFVREMHQVKGTIAQRHLLVVNNYADRATCSRRSISAILAALGLLPGVEETPIVAARLQDHDVCSIRHILLDPAEHHARSFEGHSGIGDLSIDALGSEQHLQLRGISALVANIPAMGVAGADRGRLHPIGSSRAKSFLSVREKWSDERVARP
jgi:hypothetical protein